VGTGYPVSAEDKHSERSAVSIQLMSPASGDYHGYTTTDCSSNLVSIQLMSPASGDGKNNMLDIMTLEVSIQLMSPASGDFEF